MIYVIERFCKVSKDNKYHQNPKQNLVIKYKEENYLTLNAFARSHANKHILTPTYLFGID